MSTARLFNLKSMTTCRHCRRWKASRPRGLCWGCHRTPGVRERYPVSASKFARRARPDFCGAGAVPEPTPFPPGDPRKVDVLQSRAQAGESLFSREDARRT